MSGNQTSIPYCKSSLKLITILPVLEMAMRRYNRFQINSHIQGGTQESSTSSIRNVNTEEKAYTLEITA